MSHRPPPQTIDGIKARQTHSHARINIAFPLPLLTTSVINGLRYTLSL